MKGSANTRSVTRARAVATCGECGHEREGITRHEHRPWEAEPAVHHICDECRDAIVERPLDLVLTEFLSP